MRVNHRKEHARNSVGFGKRPLRVSQLTASHTTPRCPVGGSVTARPSDISQARGIDGCTESCNRIEIRENFHSTEYRISFFRSSKGRHKCPGYTCTVQLRYGVPPFSGLVTDVPRRGVFATRTEPGLVAGGPRSGVPAALDPGAETCGPLSERSYDRSRSHSEHPLTRKPMTLV